MNENKVIHYTRFILRIAIALVAWIGLVFLLRYITDIAIWVKALLLIGLFGAMFLNIYNGKENRYQDFKQPIENLSKLDEGSFTYFIERLYRTLGFYTKIPGKVHGLKQVHELVLIKDKAQIVMQCYNKNELSLQAVQQLVGRMSFYSHEANGQILFLGTADEKVHQLARLNHIKIIEGHQLKVQMSEAASILANDLDGAISAVWCHPFKWFRKHFLEEEPRFMNDKMWLAWVKLELKNKMYHLSDTQDPKEYGVQFVAQKGEETVAVKCIGINQKVTAADLSALKASIPFYEVQHAILITNSHVSYRARGLARRLELELLNFDEFMKWLKAQREMPEEAPQK